MNRAQSKNPLIPGWMIWVQSICFSILYAIWALPETILIRHMCLIAGALIGVYEIYQFRLLFFNKKAISAWLLLCLFMWAVFHLIFLSNDFAAQYSEFTSIWKRAAIGAVFALGFGMALVKNTFSSREKLSVWVLFFFGLLTPTLIYIVKYILSSKLFELEGMVPDYLMLYSGSARHYIPKTTYVCFCLPLLGVVFGQLSNKFYAQIRLNLSNLGYFFSVLAIFFVFYFEKILNGVLCSLILFIIFLGKLFYGVDFRKNWLKIISICAVSIIGLLLLISNLQVKRFVEPIWADIKVAVNTEDYPHWKYNGAKIRYPINELGAMVSPSLYERLAWGKIGLELIPQNFLGYGLVESSFGRIAKIYWSDSRLHQSHSGWIDLTLGLGIPGSLIILLCLIVLLLQLRFEGNSKIVKSIDYRYITAASWTLFSILLMWCTTELCQRVYFDTLIFWLAFGSGVSIMALSRN